MNVFQSMHKVLYYTKHFHKKLGMTKGNVLSLNLSLKLYYQTIFTEYTIVASLVKMGPQNSENANRVWLPAYTVLVGTR